jgi:dTDP-4-dehydrorhamnose reductase
MRVLILGHKGMLGHMLYRYFTSETIEVETTDARYPQENFKNVIETFDGDYIINCIGAIPQRPQNFSINSELPIYLDSSAKVPVIHPGTDCEMDEDAYGISKRAARDYIVEKGVRTKILKTSIIGPELNSAASLLEWFLNSEGKVGGYTKAMWSGITTLEWARQCHNLIEFWDDYKVETVIEGTCLSKFNLLSLIKKVFNKDIVIDPNPNVEVDKCLIGDIKTIPIEEQLTELKAYYYDVRS